MFRKTAHSLLLISILMLSLLLALTGCAGASDGSFALKENWGISLSEAGAYSLAYEADSGASFHGDGLRYHVYTYQDADGLDGLFSWSDAEQETLYASRWQDAAQGWLTELSVPERHWPDLTDCVYWYQSQPDQSELLMLWDHHTQLYVLESFI